MKLPKMIGAHPRNLCARRGHRSKPDNIPNLFDKELRWQIREAADRILSRPLCFETRIRSRS